MITVENFSFKHIFRNLNLEFKKAHTTCIVGDNGVGKSILLDSICGNITDYSGTIAIEGDYIYLPQNIDFFGRLKVCDVIQFLLVMLESDTAKRKVLEASLPDKFRANAELTTKNFSHLSNGEKRILFFSIYSGVERDIYIFDEPFAGVDDKNKQAILDRLLQLKSKNKTVLLTNHDNMSEYAEWQQLELTIVDLNQIKI